MEKADAFYEVVQFKGSMPVATIYHSSYTSSPVGEHWHLDLEINMLDKADGKIDFYVDGRHEVLTKKSIVLINSGAVHSSVPDMKNNSREIIGLTLIIKYDFLKTLIPNIDNIYYILDGEKDRSEIRNLLSQFSNIYLHEKDKDSFNCMLISCVCQIVAYLCENCMHERRKIGEQGEGQTIYMILEYIHSNYQFPLKQELIAREFHFSRGYFSCFFKKCTGKTFKKYLTEVRLIQGEKLLRETNLSVCRIAQDIGFNDERRFIETFKKYYGITPGCFRKNSENLILNSK